ncbi:MAG: helix-turn-helix transcriptional regulator [Anaerolineales bacterium]|nr:helix-turn-helix transcriptional regulator [Anaerolineales bacterium]
MPGYRRRKSHPCHQRQRRGMRLILRPSLLLMLAEGESHGYELFDQLESFGFELDDLDSSIVYRDLRDMEDMGLIGSYWEEESKGPKRRVYRILDDGRSRLTEWIDTLDSIQGRMNKLISRYKIL